MNKNSARVRLGLIGAGPWGQNYIKTIDGPGGLDGVTLAHLASRNPESADLVDGACRISQDWRDLLANGDLDGVIIATPPALHAEMTLAAIDAGISVLVEKPMTMDAGEAEAILAAATAKDAIVRVNHIHLYSAAWEAMKREAASLGSLRAISTVVGGPGPNRPDVPVLWDWGSHDVAMCIDLVGRRPDRVSADVIEDGEALGLELNFGPVTAPVTARIVISNQRPEKQRLLTAVYGGGELIYDDMRGGDEKLRLKTTPQDSVSTVPLGDGTPLERAVLAFADAISRDDFDPADIKLGQRVVQVLEELSGKIN